MVGETHQPMVASFSALEERRQYNHRRIASLRQPGSRSIENCLQSRRPQEVKRRRRWTNEATGNADEQLQRTGENRPVLPLQTLGAVYATYSHRGIRRWKQGWRL